MRPAFMRAEVLSLLTPGVVNLRLNLKSAGLLSAAFFTVFSRHMSLGKWNAPF